MDEGDESLLRDASPTPEWVRGYQAAWVDSFTMLEAAGIAHLEEDGPVIHAPRVIWNPRVRLWHLTTAFFVGGTFFTLLAAVLNNFPDRWAYSWT